MTKRLPPDVSPVLASSERFRPFALLLERFNRLPVWLATIQNLDQTESSFLEYLAGDADIAETVAWHRANNKREQVALIEAAYTRHRMRGTDAGLSQAAIDAGGTVRRIIAPPSKFFPSASMTPAQRNAWLSQHPELRLYPRRVPGQQQVFHANGIPGGKFIPAPSTAMLRSRLRVTLVQNGVETELETADWQLANVATQVVNEIMVPGQRGYAYFGCGIPRFAFPTDAAQRRYMFRDIAMYEETTATLGMKTATPSLTPIDTDGEMVAEVRTAPTKAYFGCGIPRFAVPLNAELAMYRRIKLFDPTVPAVRVRASCHLGYSRFGMPAHTAEVQVALFGKRHFKAQGRFAGLFYVPSNPVPLQRLTASMAASKRASDKILLDTKVHRSVKAGRFKAGSVVAGSVTQQ